jgi:hypothetical protein
VLHNDDGVFVLSQNQINELGRSRDFSILRLLESVKSREAETKRARAKAWEAGSTVGTSSPPVGFPVRESITEDDILDLRIELETCKDCLEFINRL